MMKEQILEAGFRLAVRKGFKAVTRDDVAIEAKCGAGTVTYHYGDVKHLRTAIVRKAIADNNAEVLAGAMRADHPVAATAPDALKKRAARLIVG